MHGFCFDHVGMLVHDLERAQGALAVLGYDTVSERFSDPRQGIQIVFVWNSRTPEAPKLELVQPVRDDSVVSKLLVKTGATPYHVCFRVALLSAALEDLDARGFAVLGAPAPSPAFAGALFCFLYHRDLGLLELVEASV